MCRSMTATGGRSLGWSIVPPTDSPDVPLRAVLHDASSALSAAGILDPSADVELLAAHILETSRGGGRQPRSVVIMWMRSSSPRSKRRFRAAREPLQHITGTAPFRTLTLRVAPEFLCLDPRQRP